MDMSFNPEIHHRRSIRLRNYDYSKSGWYFVTMCTKDRRKYFGKIINGKMVLNREGFIVKRLIKSTEDYFKNIRMDSYQLMPDHIHMIIRIKFIKSGLSNNVRFVGARSPRPQYEVASNRTIASNIRNPEVLDSVEERREGEMRGGETPPQRRVPALGNVIGYFKFMVAKEINQFHQKQKYFTWQRNYFERIIRSDEQLYFTREYIRKNPEKEDSKGRKGWRGALQYAPTNLSDEA